MTDRPLRLCDSCGQVDDHPRHTHGLGPDEHPGYDDAFVQKATELTGGDSAKTAALIADVRDEFTISKHLDCCLADGCHVDLSTNTKPCQVALDDSAHPFDGGKTTGKKLMVAMAKAGKLGETKAEDL